MSLFTKWGMDVFSNLISFISTKPNRVIVIYEQLEEMLSKVNEDFDTGSVSKSDLAMYVFMNLKKFISADDIKVLRMKHFDDRKVLNDLLKISETKNELPEEVRKFLREHAGVFNKDKKRGPKATSATLAS